MNAKAIIITILIFLAYAYASNQDYTDQQLVNQPAHKIIK